MKKRKIITVSVVSIAVAVVIPIILVWIIYEAIKPCGNCADPHLFTQPTAAQQFSEFPEFADYEVKASKVKPKPVKIGNNKNAKMFKTRLKEANEKGVNFAGHFIIATWGCGSNCEQGAIINAKTGEIYFPDELFKSFGIEAGYPPEALDKYGYFEFKPDSKLLIMNGYGGKENGVRYLVWEENKFKLVKFIPIELLSEDELMNDN